MSASSKLLRGKWRLAEELGVGGMGKVVKAYYASSNYPCAIKFLRAEHTTSDELVTRFVNEAQISNRIGHPGVCRVIDVGRSKEGVPFLVMEYLEGETLEARLGRGPGILTIGEALEVARTVLAVLAAAHVHGIVHRDIKPDNIFVTREGAIKVLDFGIARLPGADLTQVGATLGTAGYMPPEVARGNALEVGPTSDVWSLGATLFELLTAELPLDFSGVTSRQKMLKITATTPARSLAQVLPRCPTKLVDAVDRMLAFSPQDRLGAEQALAALEQVVIAPELVGQAAPWVWDPRVAAQPRSARYELHRDKDTDAGLFESRRGYVTGGLGEPVRDGDRGGDRSGDRDRGRDRDRDRADEDDVEELHERIRQHPDDYDDHHKLVRAYLSLGDRDAAASVARTLRYLQRDNAEERELAETLDGVFTLPLGRVTRKQWREVLMYSHPSAPLSALLARLWPVLATSRAGAYDELGLEGYRRVAITGDATGIARWLAHMVGVLDMPPPDLYVREGDFGGFEVAAPTVEQAICPTLIADESVVMPQPAAARAFRCAHALARAHPYLIAASILPSSTRLRDAIHGATALTCPDVMIPPAHADKALRWKAIIESKLLPDRIDALRKSVERVVRLGGDTKAWLRGCQHTAVRVGLLMSGDLDVAVELIRSGSVSVALDEQELIRGLVAFSVSLPYLELRRSLRLG